MSAATVGCGEGLHESWGRMNAVEKILIAEETVAGLQSQLSTVETVLETAEHIAVTGEKAGRSLRRFFRVLLLLSVVAVVVVVIKNVMGDRCSMGKEPASDSESSPDDVVSDAGDDGSAGDEAAPAGDADPS